MIDSSISLQDIPAVGSVRAEALRSHGYTTVDDVADATEKELSEVQKIAKSTAWCIREGAKELRGDVDTYIAFIAGKYEVDRAVVADAFSQIAYRPGSAKMKQDALLEYISVSDSDCILHVRDQPLNTTYLFYQAGYHDVDSVIAATVEELSEIRYIGSSKATAVQTSAEKHQFGISQTDSDEDDSTEEPVVEPTIESIVTHSSLNSEDAEQTIASLSEHGASRSEALSQLQKYAIATQTGEGLYAVKSVGPVAGYLLEQHGITTLEQLQSCSLDEVIAVPELRREHALQIHTNARSEGTNPSPEHDDSSPLTDAQVTANQLSEYYESIRALRQVIRATMLHPLSDFRPDDITDPYVQYLVMLDSCIGMEGYEFEFMGYGRQHARRLPFRIDDYRAALGDGEWVTEYTAIDVEPFHERTQHWLQHQSDLRGTHRLVRPVAPTSQIPLPEIVESFDELHYALALLGELPAYPPLPVENGSTTRTIPVADLYKGMFSDLADQHSLSSHQLSQLETKRTEPISGAVAESTPGSLTEVEDFLLDYGKLTHIHRRVEPPSGAAANRTLSVFALDWYRPKSPAHGDLQALAKQGDQSKVEVFRRRLQDLINRRFIRDSWEYDYITVFPSHEKGSLSAPLVELAQEAVVETPIIYTPLLERTVTADRQRGKSGDEREEITHAPGATLRARNMLDGDSVIILDDICTTGSSLLAGAHLLREAGASRVVGVTLGLTPGGDKTATSVLKDPQMGASDIIAGLN